MKDPDTVNTVEQRFASEKSPLSFFSRKPRKLKVAFAFESTPENCLWTYDHDVARKRLERTMGDKISVITRYQVPTGESSYGPLKELMNEEPDILFATSPNMSAGALRLSLENPDKAILNCDFAQPKKNIMTYYAKFYEAAFLCGVMAGSMTRTGLLGYTTTMATHPGSTFNLNAFALGAQLVNPTAHVVNINLYRVDASDPYHMEARQALARHGVDIAMCIHQPHTPLVRRASPGVVCAAVSAAIGQRPPHRVHRCCCRGLVYLL